MTHEDIEPGRTFTAYRRRFPLMLILLLVAVSLGTAPGSTRAAAAFQSAFTAVSYSAGASPAAAKVGDLDGDGLTDIAVINTQGSLQLFFNSGARSFTRVSLNGLWPSGTNTLDLDIGDLNSDGRKDIAVAFSTQTGGVSVLFNLGNRTFAAPVNYDVCGFSNGVVIGDLDNDGDNDLAEISQCNKAGILLNNGQGTFTFAGTYGGGVSSRSIVLADLNRDGFKDVVYLNSAVGSNSSITVLLNNGNATFGTPRFYFANDLSQDLAVGDFEADGHIDVAIANSYYGLVFVLINGGNGDFVGYSELEGNTPNAIAASDFNGDGRLDYATVYFGGNSLSVFLNQGYYTYSASMFSVGQSPVDIATGNLDSDSLPDLVAVNQGGSGSITVLFSAAGPPPPPPPPPAPITLSVSTRATKTARLVDLRWSGTTSSSVDIYRNGSRIATRSNTGNYTDQFGKNAHGTFRYKVCVAGGQQCSVEAAITF